MLELIALARRRHDPLLEARGFLVLGVARMRTRDEMAGAEAFRAALKIAMRRAGAGHRRGRVDESRRDRDAMRRFRRRAPGVPRSAAPVHDAAQQHEPARGAVQPGEPRERARRHRPPPPPSIARRRRSPSSSARTTSPSARTRDSGSSRCGSSIIAGARTACAAAERVLGPRDGMVVPGTRAAGIARASGSPSRTAVARLALARFRAAVERLEAMDVYAAHGWSAECGAELAADEADIWDDRRPLRRAHDGAAVRAARGALHGAARHGGRAVAPTSCVRDAETDGPSETDALRRVAAGAASAAPPNRSAAHRGSPTAPRRRRRGAAGRAALPRRAGSRGSSAGPRTAPARDRSRSTCR